VLVDSGFGRDVEDAMNDYKESSIEGESETLLWSEGHIKDLRLYVATGRHVDCS
jgi:hypothetical protein